MWATIMHPDLADQRLHHSLAHRRPLHIPGRARYPDELAEGSGTLG